MVSSQDCSNSAGANLLRFQHSEELAPSVCSLIPLDHRFSSLGVLDFGFSEGWSWTLSVFHNLLVEAESHTKESDLSHTKESDLIYLLQIVVETIPALLPVLAMT